MYEIWEAFNDIAEGFGLTIEEFQEILKSSIMEYLNVTERQLNFDTDAVFRLFDDDQVCNQYYVPTNMSSFLHYLHYRTSEYMSCMLL